MVLASTIPPSRSTTTMSSAVSNDFFATTMWVGDEIKPEHLLPEKGALDEQIAPLAREASQLENPRWGALLRSGNDKSHLANQIERSADIYTSRVSNFLFATPFAYLRSRRGSMPHDPIG